MIWIYLKSLWSLVKIKYKPDVFESGRFSTVTGLYDNTGYAVNGIDAKGGATRPHPFC